MALQRPAVIQQQQQPNFKEMTSPEARRIFIKRITLEAWSVHKQFGGRSMTNDRNLNIDALYDERGLAGVVISLSTLWIMKEREEFAAGRLLVMERLKFRDIDHDVSVTLILAGCVAGLLGAHALSHDQMFLEKAREIAEQLEPAYHPITGLPYKHFNPKLGLASQPLVTPADISTGLLQYAYLSYKTGDPRFQVRADRIRFFMSRVEKPLGLCLDLINCETGRWFSKNSTWASSKYFTILPYIFLQSGGQDRAAMQEFETSLESVISAQMIWHSPKRGGHLFLLGYNHEWNEQTHVMDGHDLSMASLLAVAVQASTIARGVSFRSLLMEAEVCGMRQRELYPIVQLWEWAKQLTETGHEATRRSTIGLAPERIFISDEGQPEPVAPPGNAERYQIFAHQPYLAKTYFIMWRLTRDERYREWAWELVRALYTICRVPATGGYTHVHRNLVEENREFNQGDHQNPCIISDTFKYLYLIFVDDENEEENLPLSKWIFHAFGQPIPMMSPVKKKEKDGEERKRILKSFSSHAAA